MKQSNAFAAATATTTTSTIGLDLGDRHSHYCVLDRSGVRVEQDRVTTTREALAPLFRRLAPARIVMEVGGQSPWVSRLAKDQGFEGIVANPRRVELITKNERKSDRTDAELLARLGRIDPALLSPVEHRSVQAQADLAIQRARDVTVEARTMLINHVRGAVKSFGYRLAGCSAECFHSRAHQGLPKELEPALRPILRSIAVLTAQIRGFDREIQRLADERYPATKILRQIPGVGPLIALSFVLTLEDPRHVADSRQVGPYLGLVPRRHDSGSSSPQLRITKTGDSTLRRLLVIGANYILGRFGPDCDLRRFGMRIAARGDPNSRKRAKTAVARKLGVLLHHLWKTGEVYDPFYLAKRRGEPVPA